MTPDNTIALTINSKSGQLRSLREAQGMSRREVAAKLGVTIPAVQDYERNEAAGRITLTTLRKYAEVLNCDVDVTITPRDEITTSVPSKRTPPRGVPRKAAPVPAEPIAEDPPSDRSGLWTAPV